MTMSIQCEMMEGIRLPYNIHYFMKRVSWPANLGDTKIRMKRLSTLQIFQGYHYKRAVCNTKDSMRRRNIENAIASAERAENHTIPIIEGSVSLSINKPFLTPDKLCFGIAFCRESSKRLTSGRFKPFLTGQKQWRIVEALARKLAACTCLCLHLPAQ